jgi:hypothetical protein
MKTLEAPEGYELLTRDSKHSWYDYFLSRGDYGIIGGIKLLDSDRVQLDLFKNGEVIKIVSKTIAAALEFSGDLDRMNELGKL